jgi:hypothetical protein
VKLRRLPGFLCPSCAQQPGQEPGENCTKENHF